MDENQERIKKMYLRINSEPNDHEMVPPPPKDHEMVLPPPKQVKTKDGEIIDTSKAQLLDFDMATGEMIYVLPGGMKFRIKK